MHDGLCNLYSLRNTLKKILRAATANMSPRKRVIHACYLDVCRKLCVDSWYREGIKMSLEPSDYSAARNGEE